MTCSNLSSVKRLTLLLVLCFTSAHAQAKLCNPAKESCLGGSNRGSTKPAYPSKSSGIRINPSAVPTEDAFGIEALVYEGAEFAIVKGTGRIGAAISASNGEESFFGPPGFDEYPADYLQRKIDKDKYKSKKVNLATAFTIVSNKRKGLRRFDLNLGVAAKYHTKVKEIAPGGGISGIAGPITFGYARGTDIFAFPIVTATGDDYYKFKYQTETLSAGIYLNTFAFDYSKLTLTADENDEQIFINLLTTSLMLKRWILTAAQRKEDSTRPAYDSATQSLITQQIKTDYFGGIQYAVAQRLMIGAYYNYYLLDEVSFGITLFL